MSGNGEQWQSKPGRPLSMRAIVVGGALVGVVGAVAVVALLYFYGGGTDQDRAALEVLRTAGTLVIGTGGAIALLLTARRQRFTELTLEHQRDVATANERDAAEQRITELYTRAIDQLGSDHAPVRLGGLHALERLAQNNPTQRQMIVEVICAYLRVPYTPPDDLPPAEDSPSETHTRHDLRRQELQVRLTAQRILAGHLLPVATDKFWPGISLDLTEAHLHRLDLTFCHIQEAEFGGAQFSGTAKFDGTHFASADFRGAHFRGNAEFCKAHFSELWTRFDGADFSGDALFVEAEFSRLAEFHGVQFGAKAWFDGARFHSSAWFNGAQFSGDVLFGRRSAGESTHFHGARVRQNSRHSWPAGWTTRDALAGDGEEEGWLYLVRIEDRSNSSR